MVFDVVFAPEAKADLFALYDFIAERDGHERAAGYIGRIDAACGSLAHFPARGRSRDDIRPGLRITGFEHRVMIAFHFDQTSVTIDRLLYQSALRPTHQSKARPSFLKKISKRLLPILPCFQWKKVFWSFFSKKDCFLLSGVGQPYRGLVLYGGRDPGAAFGSHGDTA